MKGTANVGKLAADGSRLITTNLVIHETFVLLACRISRKAAITFLEGIYHADNVQVLHGDRTSRRRRMPLSGSTPTRISPFMVGTQTHNRARAFAIAHTGCPDTSPVAAVVRNAHRT
jgi:hypothetical protein